MRDDRVYLQHIAESIERIESYLSGSQGMLDQPSFFEDQRTQDAVLQRLETLTAVASHLSISLKSRNSHIPWDTLVATHNVVAHAYIDIKPEQVWSTIRNDVPQLKSMVERELHQLKVDDPSSETDR
jgi:uncharacterized protein with HEPN domain